MKCSINIAQLKREALLAIWYRPLDLLCFYLSATPSCILILIEEIQKIRRELRSNQGQKTVDPYTVEISLDSLKSLTNSAQVIIAHQEKFNITEIKLLLDPSNNTFSYIFSTTNPITQKEMSKLLKQ